MKSGSLKYCWIVWLWSSWKRKNKVLREWKLFFIFAKLSTSLLLHTCPQFFVFLLKFLTLTWLKEFNQYFHFYKCFFYFILHRYLYFHLSTERESFCHSGQQWLVFVSGSCAPASASCRWTPWWSGSLCRCGSPPGCGCCWPTKRNKWTRQMKRRLKQGCDFNHLTVLIIQLLTSAIVLYKD